jgi:hypothetical protein
MRIYVVAGPIGAGITEVCLEIRNEVFGLGFRVSRVIIGRPDTISVSEQRTAEQVIDRIEEAMNNTVGLPTDFIISGTEATRHCLAIKNRWPAETKIIFVRKANDARTLEAGLLLLEHHINYDRETYSSWMNDQLQLVNQYVEGLGLTWHDVEVENMFTFSNEALLETMNMSKDTFVINPFIGIKSADCVPRQLAIY